MSSAAETVHLFLKGAKTPSFNPDNPKGVIEATLQTQIKSPRDVASGQATGKSKTVILTFHKRIDKSTPLLLQALTTNETLSKAEFAIGKKMPDGKFKVSHIVKMSNPKLVSARKTKGRILEYEEMRISCTGFIKTAVTGSVWQDDWLEPN